MSRPLCLALDIDCTVITDTETNKQIKDRVTGSMINAKLREYDTKYPKYRVVMSPSNQKGPDFFQENI